MRTRFITTFVFTMLALGWLRSAQIFVNPPPAAKPAFGDLLYSSFYAATNGRQETVWNNYLAANATWNTNGIFYGLKGHTALSYFAYPQDYGTEVPAVAFTRRIICIRGHDNGATNLAIDPTTYLARHHIFMTDAGQFVVTGIKASFKRIGGGYDYCLLLLSNDLPATISTVRFVDPVAWDAKAASTHAYWWPHFNPLMGTCSHGLCGTYPTTASGHFLIISGDSGNPDFYVINGEIFFYRGRTTSGYSAQMQADCDALTTWAGLNPADHQLQLLDLNTL